MQKLIDQLSAAVAAAFTDAGYDASQARVVASNRPDLCQFQCNGAMPAAKIAHKAPVVIASEVAARLQQSEYFASAEAVGPGFLNLRLRPEFLAAYLNELRLRPHLGVAGEPSGRRVVIDYGGPNVAKPLHIGHLRSAVIGESVKRIYRYFGDRVTGDVHLGDWGLQMGLVLAQLQEQQPELPYFNPDYPGEYPDFPLTVGELETIYPAASARSKTDAEFAAKAHALTLKLQQHTRGIYDLWKNVILKVSVEDLKRNYDALDVHFDVWMGESDAEPDIRPMLDKLAAEGYLVESNGAKVVEIARPEDKKEVPPCLLVKSDGATLYATTDLATIVQRVRDFTPDRILYLADKRQSLHFEQVFRTAYKCGLVPPQTELEYIGFGTMNGRDGKPFKTRDGGVMRLQTLIEDTTAYIAQKIRDNGTLDASEVDTTAKTIAVAAIKYGDLSNLATKDYIFDLERFAAFEGNTGPYLLYTVVRIKSILARCAEIEAEALLPAESDSAANLQLLLAQMPDRLAPAYRDSAPNLVAAYAYELAVAVNGFYHETRIVTEPDAQKKCGYLALVKLAKRALEECIGLLGFSAPERM